jgi:acyl-CoA thioesterase I
LPEFLKAKPTSYGHWVRLVQAAALAVVLAAASPAAARTIRLVVLGDSLTAGLGLPPGKAFPDRLQEALRARGWDVEVLNAGVSGDTAADGLARYDWSVPADADALLVELGANDMLRGLKPAMTKKALSAILDKAQAARLPTLIAGMRAAPNLGAEYGGEFSAIYPDLAKAYNVVLYPFFLDGVAGDPKLNQPDGMHPTAEGVEVIVERIAPSVEQVLREVKQQHGRLQAPPLRSGLPLP